MTTAPGINVQSWSDIAATPAEFNLAGGNYVLAIVGGSFGTVTLNQVGPDGSTLLPVLADAVAANGLYPFTVAKGQLFQLTLDDASGVYATISPVPLDFAP